MNNNSKQTKIGKGEKLSFKTQIFGGFRKADVLEYVKSLVVSIEHDKKELEEKRIGVLALIEKGQIFGDQLIHDAQNRADFILKDAEQEANQKLRNAEQEANQKLRDAEQEANQKLKEAEEAISKLQCKHTYILEQCQKDTNHLIDLYTRKYEETKVAYEQMLIPLIELSQTLSVRIEESVDDGDVFSENKL